MAQIRPVSGHNWPQYLHMLPAESGCRIESTVDNFSAPVILLNSSSVSQTSGLRGRRNTASSGHGVVQVWRPEFGVMRIAPVGVIA